MFAHYTIDEIYEQFTRALKPSEQPFARGLAHTLGMAPAPEVPWSRVFFQDVVRALPIFFVESMPHVSDDLVHDAVTAHGLGIIAAFAVDRLQDGQIDRPNRVLFKVVNELRRTRDNALERLGPGRCDPHFDYGIGEWELSALAAAEQRILYQGAPADFASYERMAIEKQYAAFPAAMRLALAAGFSTEQLELVRTTIIGIALAFQMVDDVIDWQDDLGRGGAWAAALAYPAGTAGVGADELHRRILSSGILSQLVSRATEALQDARRAAEALGATRLAKWIEAETQTFLAFSERERQNPGATARCQIERRREKGAVVPEPAAFAEAAATG